MGSRQGLQCSRQESAGSPTLPRILILGSPAQLAALQAAVAGRSVVNISRSQIAGAEISEYELKAHIIVPWNTMNKKNVSRRGSENGAGGCLAAPAMKALPAVNHLLEYRLAEST